MSDQSLGLAMIGCGTVGGGVVQLLSRHADLYAERLGRKLELRRVLVRDVARHREAGRVDPDLLTDDPDTFFDTSDVAIVIELAGGVDPILPLVERALVKGFDMVTANKALLAAKGQQLFRKARDHGRSIAFEASCAGAIPIVNALTHAMAGNRIEAIHGILNGTCNYILTQMVEHQLDYERVLKQAQELGYAEADPTLDVTGQDAAHKLAILASLAFDLALSDRDITCAGIEQLDPLDIQLAVEMGYTVKLLASGQREQSGLALSVEPCLVGWGNPLAAVSGPFNAVTVVGDASGPLQWLGAGAGAMPTASAVMGDVMNVACGAYADVFGTLHAMSGQAPRPDHLAGDKLNTRFYMRINPLDVPGVVSKFSAILGEEGVSFAGMQQHEVDTGSFVPVVVTTHKVERGAMHRAVQRISELEEIQGEPILLRIVDAPG